MMNNETTLTKIDQTDPRVQSYTQAEQRLFAHYRLEFKTRYVELQQPNIRVRVLETGSGAPTVVVPGGNGEAFPWVALLSKLTGRRFLLLDRPGAGLSDFVDPLHTDFRRLAVNTLASVLDAFEFRKCDILCNSMGGLWSFWLALDRPEYVGRLIQLGCPAMLLGTSAPLMMRLASVPILNRRLLAMIAPKKPEDGLKGLSMLGSTPAQINRLAAEYGETSFYSQSLPAYQTSWRTLQERVLSLAGPKQDLQLGEAELRKVTQPVLFVWGTQDPFGSVAVGRRAVNILPHAELIEVPAGHLPFVDEPDLCAQHIRRFLSEAP